MTDRSDMFSALLENVRLIVANDSGSSEKLQVICQMLTDGVQHYDWVGFYLTDQAGRNLVLGPFVGEPTDHVQIPFGRGICGQAAQRRETFLVQDVSKEANYLSCSPRVRSEIVVPVIRKGEVLGELDIDSHQLSPFAKEDSEFLERVAALVSRLF
ncbi:MAG TPA: GAF domain-containing protein [Anaerolineae bacterium]|nr:GAF domain-containing protein [Anaerolineae bacterium]